MTNSPEIKGQAIQATGGGQPNDLIPGQVWYDGEAYGFKVAVDGFVGTWSSGGNMNTARFGLAGAGIQTAALGFGGYSPSGNPGTPTSNETENYNGTNWVTSANLATARRALAGAGTQTAGLGFGGYTGSPFANSASTEEFNPETVAANVKTITTS